MSSPTRRQRPTEHPEDDDVLASIRAVREMVNMEFSLSEHERRIARTKAMRYEARETSDEISTIAPGNDNPSLSDETLSWKNQCYRHKQELFEERKRRELLETKLKRQTGLLTSQLQQTREEAAVDREMKNTLVETLNAQTKHADQLKRQLNESQKVAAELKVKFQGVLATISDEKESVEKERDAAFRLLKESRQQVEDGSRANTSVPERMPSDNPLAMQIQHLVETNAKLSKEKCDLESKLAAANTPALSALFPPKECEELMPKTPVKQAASAITSSASRQALRSSRAKAMIQSLLQQKLNRLEESLEKDAKNIQSLEKEVERLEQMQSSSPNQDSLSAKKKKLADSQDRVRTKSLEVLSDMILMQLQRLIEIHKETTFGIHSGKKESGAFTKDDVLKAEWETALLKLSKNRDRILALKKTTRGAYTTTPFCTKLNRTLTQESGGKRSNQEQSMDDTQASALGSKRYKITK